VVLATNVYRKDANNNWRLLEHHASVPGFGGTETGSAGGHTVQ
jgi:hypothetical protein